MAHVLMPLPDNDFDVTEVAVPWRILTRAGHRVTFATERGQVAAADPRLLDGVIFGQLGAEPEAKRFYAEMLEDPAYKAPVSYADIELAAVDVLHLAGGHAPGMRQYLASTTLQGKVAAYFQTGRLASAICHGVLVIARARDPESGKSPLYGRRTTCLPHYMERIAYYSTAWKLGRYYRTYPAYVEDEVRAALRDPKADFVRGPITLFSKGTLEDDRAALVVEDGNYLSARWPGDAYLLGKRIVERLG